MATKSKRKGVRKATVLVKVESGELITLMDYCKKNKISVQRIIQRLKDKRDGLSTVVLNWNDPILIVQRVCRGSIVGISNTGALSLYNDEICARNAGAIVMLKRTPEGYRMMSVLDSKWTVLPLEVEKLVCQAELSEAVA